MNGSSNISSASISAPQMNRGSPPFLAGDDPDLLALSVWRDEPRLPPLVVRSIYDVEDVPIREAQALAGQAAVPRSIVVKQSSVKKKRCLVAI